MKELDIIMCVRDNWRLTAGALASIFKSTYPKENLKVIIIDNASTDFTEKLCSYLVDEGEPIVYLKQKENLNFVKGNNIGFKTSTAPYVMLLNNDTLLEENCITSMLKILKEQPDVGISGALEFLGNGMPSKDRPFIYWHPKTLLDPVLMGAEEVNSKLMNGGEYAEVDIVGSACCIIKREVLDKIGVFDELFSPCMYEQEDFFLRTKLAGFKIALALDAHFIHLVAGTTNTNPEFYQKVIKTNKSKFLQKWDVLIKDGKNKNV